MHAIPSLMIRSLVAGGLLLSAAGLHAAPAPTPAETRVGPGVTHTQDARSSGPLFINVLSVDMDRPEIAIEVEKPLRGLFAGEKVAALAVTETRPGRTVVGGVNADFWSMSPRPYTPIGPMVSDRMIWYAPGEQMDRSSFVVTRDRRVFMEKLNMRITVDTGERVLELARVNDARLDKGATLITPPVGERIALASPDFVFVPLRLEKSEFLPNLPVRARVQDAVTSPTGPLPPNVVLAAFGSDRRADAALLKPGASVTLLAKVTNIDGVIEECVGGGPLLVEDGRVVVDDESEGFGRSFVRTRHPRTAIGMSKDGRTIHMVTVDGRQPDISIGHSLQDLAQYMIDIGCHKAINLDGGGSTTMIVRGEVVNKPSDRTGPRTVTNALLVVSKAGPGELSAMRIEPTEEPLRVPAGTTVAFSARGFDNNANAIDLALAPLKWSADSRLGVLRSLGRGATLQAGPVRATGAVRITHQKGITASRSVEVWPVRRIETEPAMLLLAPGESAAISVRAFGDDGPLALLPGMATVGNADGALSASASLVTAVRAGDHDLTVSVGTGAARVPVHVGTYRAVALAPFDTLPTTFSLTGQNFEEGGTRHALETATVREGAASLRVDYSMTRGGGPTRILIPVGATLDEEPEKLGMWIHGDGREAWVRGIAVDSAGSRFMLDFTEGSKGVYWSGEWKRVAAPFAALRPDPANAGAKPVLPLTIESVYVAQEQEALKTSGTLLLDGLEAVYPPPGAATTQRP